jgi:hypothetical protein
MRALIGDDSPTSTVPRFSERAWPIDRYGCAACACDRQVAFGKQLLIDVVETAAVLGDDAELAAAESWVDDWQAGIEQRAAQATAFGRRVSGVGALGESAQPGRSR